MRFDPKGDFKLWTNFLDVLRADFNSYVLNPNIYEVAHDIQDALLTMGKDGKIHEVYHDVFDSVAFLMNESEVLKHACECVDQEQGWLVKEAKRRFNLRIPFATNDEDAREYPKAPNWKRLARIWGRVHRDSERLASLKQYHKSRLRLKKQEYKKAKAQGIDLNVHSKTINDMILRISAIEETQKNLSELDNRLTKRWGSYSFVVKQSKMNGEHECKKTLERQSLPSANSSI